MPHRHPPKSEARTTIGPVRRVYEEGPCRIKRNCPFGEPKPTPLFDHCSVTTANPNPANGGPLPTWAYAVLPIVTVPIMPMIMVVMIVVMMVVMIVIVRVMFMIVIVIMPLIVTLLLMTLLLLTLLLIVTVIVIFSEGRYRKRQSTCYLADESEFANHLGFPFVLMATGAQRTAGLHWREPTPFPLHNLRTAGFYPKPRVLAWLKLPREWLSFPSFRPSVRAWAPRNRPFEVPII